MSIPMDTGQKHAPPPSHEPTVRGKPHKTAYSRFYSTVTDFARLRGLSTSHPFPTAI